LVHQVRIIRTETKTKMDRLHQIIENKSSPKHSDHKIDFCWGGLNSNGNQNAGIRYPNE
jgi:hypothetical protein